MADEEVGERKDATERRVYNLPTALVAKLRAFQASQNIQNETEAARRLIESALQARETVFDILIGLHKTLSKDSNLKEIASDIVRHSLVTGVNFVDNSLIFSLKDGHSGKVSIGGYGPFSLYYTSHDWHIDNWERFDKRKQADLLEQSRLPIGGWEAPAADLDDEIPF